MMLFMENIKLAVGAIRVNKMRSFLTMLGIIIGISSVIAISSIGASAQGAIEDEFESMGGTYLYIMPNWYVLDEIGYDMLFSWDDIEAVKQRFPEDIRYAAPYATAGSSTKVGRMEADLSLYGVGADYNKFSTNIEIIHGRMINQKDVDGGRNSVVIPLKAAKNLFGKSDVVGETLPATVMESSVDLTIVGVYDVAASFFTSFDTSTRYTCYMAYSALSRSDWPSSYIEIYANENKDIAEQAQAFVNYVERYKGTEPGSYMYESAEGQATMINTVLGYLSVAIAAIAAISLLVGGIGIMNIMLVSVTERTREIGIRKSLGARTRDILVQFLIEAMILSVIGGLIGTALGIGIAALGALIAGVGVVVEPATVILAVSFSAGVGLLFGLLPARKAARLDPIEALRYE